MTQPPQPMGTTERARQWAIALLRQTADALEQAPRGRAAEVLMTIGPILKHLDQARGLLEVSRTETGW